MKRKIFNINAGSSFVDVLAERYLKEYEGNPEGLANVLFLLPNRRACQSLSDAFVRCRGLTPTILPQIKPIAEADEDEVILTLDSSVLENLLPAINETDRVLQFTKLILKKSELGLDKVTLAQAYVLARNLSSLMDMTYNEQLKFDKIKDLVDAEYAEHWQQTLELLEIITRNWPEILRENQKNDVAERRNLLLSAEMDLWQKMQTSQRIVVAGTTAAFPILKQLTYTVLNLPNGEVYLYGLDKYLSAEDWEKIDENHPQYELKELLEYLHISRDAVENIDTAFFTVREKITAETMRPAETTAAWRDLTLHPLPAEAFTHIKLINCDDVRQEAQAIALIIRHTLETPEKTAALVTMDRNLSRRVVSELQKWNIAADDSAGKPLSLSPIGIYLQLICKYMEERTDTAMISLLKHPFTACGKAVPIFYHNVRKLEYALRSGIDFDDEIQNFYDDFCARIRPLIDLYEQPAVDLQTIFKTHIRVAENLADTDNKKGAQIIWKNDAGNVAAEWVSDFAIRSAELQTIKTSEYSAFIRMMLSEKSVRARYGTHPRVKILGPIEARLTQYDVTIIGEANEGTWPKIPEADMWMSRPMKKSFGFPLPERQIGVMAADFAHLLNAPEVYITRAKKVGKDPTNKSRWWLRFETVLEANFGTKDDAYSFIYEQPYAYWAKMLDRMGEYHPISAPRPCPKVKRRPQKLSATNIERWMRNPYEIYAKYILNLRPLDELDTERDMRNYGTIVHNILKEYNNSHDKDKYPDNALKELLERGREAFAADEIPSEKMAFWWPRYVKNMEWVVAQERVRRGNIAQLYNECRGEMSMPGPLGSFEVFADADRIEKLKDGTLNIVDYKTGNDSRKTNEVTSGKAPQLPIEGLIAQKGGFKDIAPAQINSLQYWALKDETLREVKDVDCLKSMEIIEQTIQNLINAYAKEEQPYLVKPRPSDMDGYSDYDHLSRLDEWCVHGNKTEE